MLAQFFVLQKGQHGILRPNIYFRNKKKKFSILVGSIFKMTPYLFKINKDKSFKDMCLRRSMRKFWPFTLSFIRGNFGGNKMALKVMQYGFYWPTLYKDAHIFCICYDRCQRNCNIGKHDEMPWTSNFLVELFDAWRIDFMGLSLFFRL